MPRLRVTLDTNAIIALERNEENASAVLEIVTISHCGALALCVSAIAAAERDRSPDGVPNFNRFIERLAAADLSHVELLNPPGHWDMTFSVTACGPNLMIS